MLQAPSPRNATIEPAELALVLAHGQQVGEQLAGVEVVGEGVDDRDAGVRRHLVDARLRVGAPDDDRGLAAEHPGHVGDRLAHADAGQLAVDEHRVAAELGDAGGERRLGAQGGLVEDHRDRARAGERLRVVRRGLERGGQVQHPALLLGAQVVVAEEVTGHGVAPIVSSRMPGQAARKASASSCVEHERRREPQRGGRRVVDDEATRQRGGRDLGGVAAGELHAEPEPLAADLGDARVGGQAGAQVLPQPGRRARAGRRARWCRSRRGRRRRRPGCRRTSCRGGRAAAGRPRAPRPRQAPIGMPPARPLATVTTSGVTPWPWWANQRPVRPMPDCTSSSQSRAPCRVATSRAAREVALRRHDDAGLALDRLEQHGRGLVGDGRGERVGVAVRHEGDDAGQRLERRAVGLLGGQRQRAHGAAVEAALGRDHVGAAGTAGQLERRLVGLGAGVGEEDLAGGRARPTRGPGAGGSRRARPAGRRRRSWRCGRACRAAW